MSDMCDVYWGSHGCHRERGHEGTCECDCCHCGDHHPYPHWPDESVHCVAKAPYYGPETRFYGDDVAALGLPNHDVPIERDCIQCGLHWQEECGEDTPDPCLGMLPGVWSACCGHGEKDGYIAFENGMTIRFDSVRVDARVVARVEAP